MSIGFASEKRNERISDILLQKTEHVYQAMWNVDNLSVFGYEALIRFPDGLCGGDIEKSFALARTEGILYELDTRSIANAISRYPLQLLNLDRLLLFVNIFPSTLIHPQFEAFLEQLLRKYPQIRGKVAFEINETLEEDYIWRFPVMKERVSLLKENGLFIALDDVSKREEDLQKIVEYSPDYIKLDRYFAAGLATSKEKQQMISRIIQYSSHKKGIILEGIEEEVDLEQAKRLNVPVVQGYLLGRPQQLTTASMLQETGR